MGKRLSKILCVADGHGLRHSKDFKNIEKSRDVLSSNRPLSCGVGCYWIEHYSRQEYRLRLILPPSIQMNCVEIAKTPKRQLPEPPELIQVVTT
jgi:hypothetical protein